MAVNAATQTTYDQVGIREDLSNIIYNIDPRDTPFVSMIKKEGKPKNRIFDWQTDKLRDANPNNAQLEGNDAVFKTPLQTVRLKNSCQIMDEAVIVSDTANAVDTAGRENELSYQVAKSGVAIRLDMEARAVGNLGSVFGTRGTPRQTAGFAAWITTNASRNSPDGADGGFQTSTGLVSAATNSTAQRAFTETLLKGVLRSVYAAGGMPTTVMVGPFNKEAASAFTGRAQPTQNYGNEKSSKGISILGAAAIYVGDFHTVRLVPNRHQQERDALVIDPSKWCIRHLEPFRVKPLSRTGHSEKRLLSVEWGLQSKNQAASGIIADLTTA